MRKRSKYRPKPVLANPLAYVIESITPLAKHDDALVDLKLKNHLAMTVLTRGEATKQDMDVLIAAVNMTEAMHRLGFGTEYKDIVNTGLASLYALCNRGAESGRFVLRAEEMKALNNVMELHDAQLEIATVKDIERGIAIIENERRQKKMVKIKGE